MEILPRTNLNFDKLADRITDEFFTGVSLNEGVIKVARQMELNPEQTRRLVEKTNTVATVRMLKTAQDKKAVFNLADFDAIRQATHPVAAQPQEKTASVGGDVPYEFPDMRKPVYDFPVLEKIAEAKKENHLSDIFQQEKKIQELTRSKVAAELSIQNDIDFVISEFSRWEPPDFSKFAAEAVTLYGDNAAAVLSGIAEYLGEKQEFTKVAYLIDDTQPLLVKVGRIVDGLCRLVDLDREAGAAKELLSTTWDKARHGDN